MFLISNIAISTPFKSTTEAGETWGRISALYESIKSIADDIGDDKLLLAINAQHAKFIRTTTALKPSIKGTHHITIKVPTPSLVLAYSIYNDITRAREISDNNNTPHPGFMVGDIVVLDGQ